MESALELELKIHYHEFDQVSGPWNGYRVRKLCNVLKLTQDELARYIRLPPHMLNQYITKGKFPGCVKLVLDLLERSAKDAYLGVVPLKPLLPALPNG